VPVVAARRAGFTLRPHLRTDHPMVRRLARQGAWAGVYLALTQVLLAVVLVLANRIEGGVVAYQVAFTVFLLPHALFAVPALTALFPRLSRQALASDWDGFAASVTRGLDAIAFFALAAGAAMFALSRPLARVVLFGASVHSAPEVGGALRGFAAGLVGYGAFLFLTRAFYALHDARTPAVANAATVALGGVAMVAGFHVADHPHVGLLAAVHSGVYLLGALALFFLLVARGDAAPAAVGRVVGAHLVSAVAAGGVMVALVHVLPVGSRTDATITVVVAGGAGLLVLGAARLLVRPAGSRLLPDLLTPAGD
jgi:putative peptidoglycan lipid II flippase